jgi:hypothetical protein
MNSVATETGRGFAVEPRLKMLSRRPGRSNISRCGRSCELNCIKVSILLLAVVKTAVPLLSAVAGNCYIFNEGWGVAVAMRRLEQVLRKWERTKEMPRRARRYMVGAKRGRIELSECGTGAYRWLCIASKVLSTKYRRVPMRAQV